MKDNSGNSKADLALELEKLWHQHPLYQFLSDSIEKKTLKDRQIDSDSGTNSRSTTSDSKTRINSPKRNIDTLKSYKNRSEHSGKNTYARKSSDPLINDEDQERNGHDSDHDYEKKNIKISGKDEKTSKVTGRKDQGTTKRTIPNGREEKGRPFREEKRKEPKKHSNNQTNETWATPRATTSTISSKSKPTNLLSKYKQLSYEPYEGDTRTK